MTAFIVERAFGGVTHGPPEKKMGIKVNTWLLTNLYWYHCRLVLSIFDTFSWRIKCLVVLSCPVLCVFSKRWQWCTVVCLSSEQNIMIQNVLFLNKSQQNKLYRYPIGFFYVIRVPYTIFVHPGNLNSRPSKSRIGVRHSDRMVC